MSGGSEGFTVEEFVAVVRGFLLGFVRVRTPAGVVFHDVPVFRRNGMVWAAPGGRPRLDSEGRQQRDHSGRRMWNPVVSFASKETEERFSRAVVKALRSSHPEVLGGDRNERN